MLKKPGNLLFLIIVMALALRLGGITQGFPYVFHPDEPTIVRSALQVRFNANPGHFDWPHLYIYFNYMIYMAFAFLRNLLTSLNLKDVVASVFPIIWDDNLIFYLITRVLSAIIGSLTLIPIYLTGKKLFNEKVGLLAAFGYATFPAQVLHSHYTMPDTPMVFLLAWGMYYGAKILVEKDSVNYVLSGFFFGLSASTKYNGVLGVVLIPLAHFFAPEYSKVSYAIEERKVRFFDTLILITLAAFSSILGFAIGTPFSVFDSQTFLRKDNASGALWQFTNVGQLNILNNLDLIYKRIFLHVGEDVAYVAIVATVVIGLVALSKIIIRRKDEYDYPASLFFIITIGLLFYVASHEKARSQYFFITYPFLAILFGYFVYLVFNLVRSRSSIGSLITLAVTLFIPFYYSSLVTLRFINNDTRLTLGRWGREVISSDKKVLYDADDLKVVVSSIVKNYSSVGNATPGELYDYFISGKGVKPSPDFKPIYRIDNRLKLGPEIVVYKRTI